VDENAAAREVAMLRGEVWKRGRQSAISGFLRPWRVAARFSGSTAVLCAIVLLLSSGCATTPNPQPRPTLSPGQNTRSWDAVVALDWGQDIAVRLTTGGEILGTFEAADGMTLTMTTDAGLERTLDRDDVLSVDARVILPSSKAKYSLRGALVGAGSTLLTLALFCEWGDADCSVGSTGIILAPIAAGIGALWGRAFGQPATTQRVRVYER
jgi:hypothetical protein